ncbi:PTS sugar transporter subunit IIA [uncultured Olegusella sp.]|uniref:PTS sugar transporter subunit IIA n=1 Tax=uncultured Olegusella sp. TaxID=1979846 RepID=UPI0026087E60|nr:PTS sugar transporter subunit IIA [uncultured Olegusella sp.]
MPLNEGQANNIQLELAYQLGFSSREDIQKERYQPMLKEILSEDLIECDYPAADRNQAVRKAGSLLVQKGLASEEYIDAMIENVEVNGTYIVIAPGIAMPHARPEKGAKSVGFSIVTLKEPVVFGHPSNDPVAIVIGLCAIDHQTHLKALSELADILSDPEKVIQLRQAVTPQDVLSLIGEGK